jgi:hypothetical protein
MKLELFNTRTLPTHVREVEPFITFAPKNGTIAASSGVARMVGVEVSKKYYLQFAKVEKDWYLIVDEDATGFPCRNKGGSKDLTLMNGMVANAVSLVRKFYELEGLDEESYMFLVSKKPLEAEGKKLYCILLGSKRELAKRKSKKP